MCSCMWHLRESWRVGLEEEDNFIYLGQDLQTHFEYPLRPSLSSLKLSVGQQHYIEQIDELWVSPERAKQKDADATKHELDEYRGGLGKVGWVVGSTVPQAALEASLLPRKVNCLKVEDLLLLNKAIRKVQHLAKQRIWSRRLFQSKRMRPSLGVLPDSSLNNEVDEEEKALTGDVEKSETQQAFLVCAVEERPHLVAYGQSRVPMNLLAWGSNKCPRKVIGSFGAEGISLVGGVDRAIGLAYLLDELQGWEPLRVACPTTPIFALTDGDSVVSFLCGGTR